jgi:hypothetical protein
VAPTHLGCWPSLGSSQRCKDEFIAVSFKLAGCERPEDGEQPKRIGPIKGKIYVLIQNVHLVVLRDNNQSQCTERIIQKRKMQAGVYKKFNSQGQRDGIISEVSSLQLVTLRHIYYGM